MAVGAAPLPELAPVAGVRLGTAAAGIRRSGGDDVTVIELGEGATCAAVFTQNAFCAAPVIVARGHLAAAPRWLLINSGNANAGTGAAGLEAAERSCQALAERVGGRPEQVLPFSTGVIGEALPLDALVGALPAALAALSSRNWLAAARAIMTTDTRPKGISRVIDVDGGRVTITGIAKGAGMIYPNMATMLAYIATDARLDRDRLQAALRQSVDVSFNCISVDGDTSTNDACVAMATGRSGVSVAAARGGCVEPFQSALTEVCQWLAEQIVRDGEGATKLIRVRVEEGADDAEAHRVGKTIAHSPLVKTAFFAGDPNWGRILAAVGRAGVDGLDIGRVSLWLGDVCVARGGVLATDYDEAAAQAVMAGEAVTVRVTLGRGRAVQEILTCDLSHDYVRINAEYRT